VSSLLILLSDACDLLALLVIVRVFISWIPGVNQWNPIVKLIRQIADPILAPFRRVLPSFGGIDLSPLLAIIVIREIGTVFYAFAVYGSISIGHLIISAIGQLILNLIILVCVLVLIRVVLSLFHADPWHPLTMAIREVSRPFVKPFVGVAAASRTASVDTAALFAFIAYLILYFVARQALLALGGGLLV
jgi:YggT family protein